MVINHKQKIFVQKKLSKKNSGKICVQKKFSKKVFGKKILSEKFLVRIFFGSKHSCPNKFFVHKNSSKRIWCKENLVHKTVG